MIEIITGVVTYVVVILGLFSAIVALVKIGLDTLELKKEYKKTNLAIEVLERRVRDLEREVDPGELYTGKYSTGAYTQKKNTEVGVD